MAMVAEVGGNIADAQTAVGVGTIGVRSDECGERFGMLPIPTPAFRQDCRRIVIGMKNQAINEVAM